MNKINRKDRLRRTMMFIPGNNPSMMTSGHMYGADSIMFDLEDSVAIREKDSARLLVFNALQQIDYGDTETVVRVNSLDTSYGIKDIEAMVAAGIDIIRLPKTDDAQDVIDADNEITRVEKELGIEVGRTGLMAAIESAIGVINAYEIATASDRLIGVALGAEDFVTNMKTDRSASGIELLAARSNILLATRAAGVNALDTVYSDVNNEEGLIKETELIKQLGFDGKSVIHPGQIDVINKIYEPTQEEINYALRVVTAIKEAEERGSGVVAVDGNMVDGPIVDRAERTIQLAKAAGVYKEENSDD